MMAIGFARRGLRTVLAAALLALATGAAWAQAVPPAAPTWREHIGPLVHRSCSPCHRPGQSAPFSLLTYSDVAQRAHFVVYVTGLRYMPPWRADPAYRHFRDERQLSDAEIALIRRWVERGAPKARRPRPWPRRLSRRPRAWAGPT